jgi:hypothetical protein
MARGGDRRRPLNPDRPRRSTLGSEHRAHEKRRPHPVCVNPKKRESRIRDGRRARLWRALLCNRTSRWQPTSEGSSPASSSPAVVSHDVNSGSFSYYGPAGFALEAGLVEPGARASTREGGWSSNLVVSDLDAGTPISCYLEDPNRLLEHTTHSYLEAESARKVAASST